MLTETQKRLYALLQIEEHKSILRGVTELRGPNDRLPTRLTRQIATRALKTRRNLSHD